MFVLGIAGPMGSGKTYAARTIQFYFKDSVIVSFADPIKDIGAALSHNTIQDLRDVYGTYGIFLPYQDMLKLGKKYPTTPGIKNRELLRAIGSYGRQKDPDFWVKIAKRRMRDYPQVIIDDVRFSNEVPILTHLLELVGEYKEDHESETGEWRNANVTPTWTLYKRLEKEFIEERISNAIW